MDIYMPSVPAAAITSAAAAVATTTDSMLNFVVCRNPSSNPEALAASGQRIAGSMAVAPSSSWVLLSGGDLVELACIYTLPLPNDPLLHGDWISRAKGLNATSHFFRVDISPSGRFYQRGYLEIGSPRECRSIQHELGGPARMRELRDNRVGLPVMFSDSDLPDMCSDADFLQKLADPEFRAARNLAPLKAL
jgi:hypothetical protein